jgi:hypothetical protein
MIGITEEGYQSLVALFEDIQSYSILGMLLDNESPALKVDLLQTALRSTHARAQRGLATLKTALIGDTPA